MNTKKHILLIDDNHDILDALQMVLEMEGYQVSRASTQDEIESVLHNPTPYPDLIMLDVLLSGQDGRVVAYTFKHAEHTKNIPIIMMSAHPNVEKSIKDAGADDFIPKPFRMDDLLSKIQLHLAKNAVEHSTHIVV